MAVTDSTRSLVSSAGLWLVVTATLLSGCGDSEQRNRTSEKPRDFSSTDCGDSIEASLAPSPDVTDGTDIARYEMAVEGTQIEVGLHDSDGAALGTLETNLELDVEPGTGLLEEWRVQTTLRENGESPASQTLRGRSLGQGRLWFEIVHRAGSTELKQWSVVGPEGKLQRMSLGVALEEGASTDGENRLRGPDGAVYAVLPILEPQEDRVPEQKVQTWLDRQVGSAFQQDQSWQRLVAASDDLAFWRGADARVRRCQIDETERAADEVTRRSQSVCPYATERSSLDNGAQTRRQPQCNDEGEAALEFVLQADTALGAVGSGAAITAGLVAAGVVVSGPAIAITFAGASVAALVVGNAIGDSVNNNKDTVFEVGGEAGEAFWDNDGGDDFQEFFSGSSGDPHLDTHDGLSYTFHGAGEFVLVEAAGEDPLTIQVRQEPLGGSCPDVAVNTAVATKVGETRVGIYARRSERLWVDGEPTDLPGGSLALPDGGVIEKSSPDADAFEIRWPGTERLKVEVRSDSSGEGFVDVSLGLPDHRRGQVRGLLGNFNGNPDDDIRTRDGTQFDPPVDWSELTGAFADAWRIDPSKSLFDYASGNDSSTYVDEQFPSRPTTVEDLPSDRRSNARKDCQSAGIEDEAVLEDCVIDVACTGDSAFVDSHTDREPESDLAVNMPIDLNGWTHEGSTSSGNWDVATNGLSVTQTYNDRNQSNPSMFVSPTDYFDTTIRGTLKSTDGGDNDHMGFVFGYQKPLSANGDDPSVFDLYAFTWKEAEQDNTAPEGMTLLRATPSAASYNWWSVQPASGFEILDTNHGSSTGWTHGTEHQFELTYTKDLIEIAIDGKAVLSATSDEVGHTFQAGRFGFYNFSQADTTYSNFSASDEPAPAAQIGVDPTRTFYRVDPGDTAKDAVPIHLPSRGIQPGDRVELRRVGDFLYDSNGNDQGYQMFGVFSRSSRLEASDKLNRVPDAIDAGEDTDTLNTFSDDQKTNIPEDFLIADFEDKYRNRVRITVPQGAKYLFVAPEAQQFHDNSDPDDDYGLDITKVK